MTPKPPTLYGPYQCPFDGSLLRITSATGLKCSCCGATGTSQDGMVQPPPFPAIPDLSMTTELDPWTWKRACIVVGLPLFWLLGTLLIIWWVKQ